MPKTDNTLNSMTGHDEPGLLGWGVEGSLDFAPGNPLTGVALYRLFTDDGNLLYVGISADFGQRWKDHVASKSWWREIRYMTIVWYADEETALQAERYAIADEMPQHNDAGNPIRRRAGSRKGSIDKTPEARRARNVYRKSVSRGAPLSDRALGKRYGRSRTWGASRIREVQEQGTRNA
jgi:GIY-YIG catalytic domain